jgi:SPP1 gp7 family putative phage head morphogenesis protein
MKTANEAFMDALIRHQIGLTRLAPGISRKVITLLNASEADVKEQLLAREIAGLSTTRLNGLLKALHAIRSDAWKKTGIEWQQQMEDLAEAEGAFMDMALNAVSPAILETTLPTVEKLRGLVETTPFQGDVMSGWTARQEAGDIARMEQSIRIGMTQGESSEEITRRILGTEEFMGTDGMTQITRNNAQSITRTAVNAIANAAKQEYYAENEDLLGVQVFLATLDSRTTLLCGSLDHQEFRIGEGPVPPLHWNCRSLRMAVIDRDIVGDRPARDFTEQQLLREYAEESGIEVVKERDDLPRGTKKAYDQFARGRMRDLTGTVPSTTTYSEWLKGQSAAFQDDILGPARGKLFREGGYTLDRFVSAKGDTLTLKQLKMRDAATLKELGINP